MVTLEVRLQLGKACMLYVVWPAQANLVQLQLQEACILRFIWAGLTLQQLGSCPAQLTTRSLNQTAVNQTDGANLAPACLISRCFALPCALRLAGF
jgi:hypothetical protein